MKQETTKFILNIIIFAYMVGVTPMLIMGSAVFYEKFPILTFNPVIVLSTWMFIGLFFFWQIIKENRQGRKKYG
jgi:hypothetical protein